MYLDPICTYILTRLFPRFLKGLIWLSSKTVLHFLTLNSGTRYLACENFITSYIIIFYYCGICLLLEPRLVEVYRFYLQSWFHVLVLNVANKCSKYIPLRYRGAQHDPPDLTLLYGRRAKRAEGLDGLLWYRTGY